MAPGGHLDSGIFTIIFIFLTIMIMTLMMVRYGWGGQRECAKRDSLNGWGGTFEGAQKVRMPTMTLMIIVMIMAAGSGETSGVNKAIFYGVLSKNPELTCFLV